MTKRPAIMLFDGECSFCSGNARSVASMSRNRAFWFCAMQSSAGQALLQRHGFSVSDWQTFVLIEEDGTICRKAFK